MVNPHPQTSCCPREGWGGNTSCNNRNHPTYCKHILRNWSRLGSFNTNGRPRQKDAEASVATGRCVWSLSREAFLRFEDNGMIIPVSIWFEISCQVSSLVWWWNTEGGPCRIQAAVHTPRILWRYNISLRLCIFARKKMKRHIIKFYILNYCC